MSEEVGVGLMSEQDSRLVRREELGTNEHLSDEVPGRESEDESDDHACD